MMQSRLYIFALLFLCLVQCAYPESPLPDDDESSTGDVLSSGEVRTLKSKLDAKRGRRSELKSEIRAIRRQLRLGTNRLSRRERHSSESSSLDEFGLKRYRRKQKLRHQVHELRGELRKLRTLVQKMRSRKAKKRKSKRRQRQNRKHDKLKRRLLKLIRKKKKETPSSSTDEMTTAEPVTTAAASTHIVNDVKDIVTGSLPRGANGSLCRFHQECSPGHCCLLEGREQRCHSVAYSVSRPCADSCQCAGQLQCFTTRRDKLRGHKGGQVVVRQVTDGRPEITSRQVVIGQCKAPITEDVYDGVYLNRPRAVLKRSGNAAGAEAVDLTDPADLNDL